MNELNLNDEVIIYPNQKGWAKIQQVIKKKYQDYNTVDTDKYFREKIVEGGEGYQDQLYQIMFDLGDMFYMGNNFLENTTVKRVAL